MLNTKFTENPEAMDVRVEFYPEHAGDFVFENEDGSLPSFATAEFDDVQDVFEFVREFEPAIKDMNIYFRATGKVVNLQDFTYEI